MTRHYSDYMKTKNTLILMLCIVFIVSYDTNSYGQYSVDRNIHMGDPFVLLDNGAYYLYGTTGGAGFKAWKSTNLMNWEPLRNVFTRTEKSWGNSSFWAPEVCSYRGKYYMTYSASGINEKGKFKLCLAISDRPEGPFTDIKTPWLEFSDWSCIDASLFIDNDSVPYLFFDKVGVIEDPWHLFGIIYMVRLTEDLMTAETAPELVAQADQQWEEMDPKYKSSCNEGAFVFRSNNKYYLTYSSGHYLSQKYGIGYSTADSPFGPWTKSPDNTLVKTDIEKGISGPGHNSITWSPDRKIMYLVYHGHADPDQSGGDRQVFIDKIIIDDNGSLKIIRQVGNE